MEIGTCIFLGHLNFPPFILFGGTRLEKLASTSSQDEDGKIRDTTRKYVFMQFHSLITNKIPV